MLVARLLDIDFLRLLLRARLKICAACDFCCGDTACFLEDASVDAAAESWLRVIVLPGCSDTTPDYP